MNVRCWKPWWMLVLVVWISLGCARRPAVQPVKKPVVEELGRMGAQVLELAPSIDMDMEVSETEPLPEFPRMIVYTASIELRVEDPKAAMDEVWQLAQEVGGYVVSSTVQEHSLPDGTRGTEAKVSIRVPAERLQEVLDRLADMALDVLRESLTSQDVTEEYVDLNARLRNLKATEEELLNFLKEAQNAEELLAVHRELTRVREDIERLEGRKRYLEQVSRFALIEVYLRPKEVQPPILPDTWSASAVFKAAVRALVRALQELATLGIWLVVFALPLFLLLGGVIWMIWRLATWVWRRSKKGVSPSPKQQ